MESKTAVKRRYFAPNRAVVIIGGAVFVAFMPLLITLPVLIAVWVSRRRQGISRWVASGELFLAILLGVAVAVFRAMSKETT